MNSRGTVGILYYDLRDDTSTKDGSFMTAELFTSTDGGRTWSASRRATPTFDHAAAAPAGGFFLGDYQGLDAAGTSFQRSSQRICCCRRTARSARIHSRHGSDSSGT